MDGRAAPAGMAVETTQKLTDGQPYNDPILVGALPKDLKAQVDMMVAISPRTTDEKDAAAFIQFITGPDVAPVWKNRGTYPYQHVAIENKPEEKQ
jgi:ABC-type glycerol-3-phosphate transport system substrate-binding protein